jgi:hypothetical protein
MVVDALREVVMGDSDPALLDRRPATRVVRGSASGYERAGRRSGRPRHGRRDGARPLARTHLGHSAHASRRHAAVRDVAVARGVRPLLVVVAVVMVLVGLLLTALPTRTAEWFAWTIDVPMTAVFLGSSYVSIAVLAIAGAWSTSSAGARLAAWSVLAVALLTFLITLVHVDVLHLGGDRSRIALLVAGGWLVTWAAVPPSMGIALRVQARSRTAVRAVGDPLPRALRALLAVLAVVLVCTGGALLVSPTWPADVWPWPLTPLTAGAVGAVLVGHGLAAGHAYLIDDATGVRPLGWGVGAFVLLQSVSLVRHGNALDWLGWGAWTYVAGLALTCAVSAWILLTEADAVAPGSSR